MENNGATRRNRTGDLLITNQLLYQLSYISEINGIFVMCPILKINVTKKAGNTPRCFLRALSKLTPVAE